MKTCGPLLSDQMAEAGQKLQNPIVQNHPVIAVQEPSF